MQRRYETRPLILIGHSLGGLIMQRVFSNKTSISTFNQFMITNNICQALVEACKSHDMASKSLIQSCIGILFFGVPNQGLDRRSIESLVQGHDNEHFLRDLSVGSEFVFTLHSDFREHHGNMIHCPVVSFYETEGTAIVEVCMNGPKTI
jgi:hypothetical protein